MKTLSFLAVFALIFPACPPSPSGPADVADGSGITVVDTDGGDGSVKADAGDSATPGIDSGGDAYSQACAHLSALGCAEGKMPNCAVTMKDADGIVTDLLGPKIRTCVLSAPSPAALRGCGPAWKNSCK
jgi:hypothetical protein